MSALTSFRGAAKCMEIILPKLAVRAPSWTTAQNWILRAGLHRLQKPLPRRGDWALVMDQSINIGSKKVTLVLASSLESIRKRKFKLRHKDMHVAAISIESSCDGHRIAQILEDVALRIGCPAQIVTDGGTNLAKGIRIFKQAHPKVAATLDITHRAALLFKKKLENDVRWKEFTECVRECKRKVVLTDLAWAAPPKPRDKSRWQNLEPFAGWAERTLAMLEAPGERGRPSKAAKDRRARLEGMFGWIRGFESEVAEWSDCLAVAAKARSCVKSEGLRKDSADIFRNSLGSEAKRESSARMAEELAAFMESQAGELPDGIPWLGCSDVIESVFGKYKIFTSRSPLVEVGKAVLAIPLMTADVTEAEIAEAMKSVSCKDVKKWLDENIGRSLLAKRQELSKRCGIKNKMKKFEFLIPKAACF